MTDLVNIRCQRCRRILRRIPDPPKFGDGGTISVPRCSNCFRPDPRDVVKVLRNEGSTSMPMQYTFDFNDLRAAVERARKNGRTVTVDMSDIGVIAYK